VRHSEVGMMTTLIHLLLIAAALLCSLVAGLLLSFAIVVMPGIRSLNDKDFIQAFRAMDGVIQKNQPVFMLVWIGSVVVLATATLLGFWELSTVSRWLLIIAAGLYFLGVQLPTAAINVPLNNQLQALDVDTMSARALAEARERFERPWNRANVIRTACALTSVLVLLVLLLVAEFAADGFTRSVR
jgi:uncharacterized membrane protein